MNTNEEVVYRVLKEIADEEGVVVGELGDDDNLVEKLGFKSLHIARILATLEMELDIEPFESGELSITEIATVGDLVDAFEDPEAS